MGINLSQDTPEAHFPARKQFQKAGERTRTVDIQLGKLTFYH